MTPTELETYIRQRYNASSDNFWSSSELQTLMYDACMQMAKDAFVIERVYTTTTVIGTQQYPLPTNTLAIKRITYFGQKLQKITFREDDQLTGLNQNSLSEGFPQYYALWNNAVYLRPIPNDTQELKIFTFNMPQAVSTNSPLEIPDEFHLDIADYVIAQMHAKERDFVGAQYWQTQWEKRLLKIKQWNRRRLQSDSLQGVLDQNTLNESFLGTV